MENNLKSKSRSINWENVMMLLVFGAMILYVIWQITRFDPSIAIAHGVTL